MPFGMCICLQTNYGWFRFDGLLVFLYTRLRTDDIMLWCCPSLSLIPFSFQFVEVILCIRPGPVALDVSSFWCVFHFVTQFWLPVQVQCIG